MQNKFMGSTVASKKENCRKLALNLLSETVIDTGDAFYSSLQFGILLNALLMVAFSDGKEFRLSLRGVLDIVDEGADSFKERLKCMEKGKVDEFSTYQFLEADEETRIAALNAVRTRVYAFYGIVIRRFEGLGDVFDVLLEYLANEENVETELSSPAEM